MSEDMLPEVVLYLYVHREGDDLRYPTGRAAHGAHRLATRYLECAAVQAASLRMADAACEVSLVCNLADPAAVGQRGARLLDLLRRFGVRVLHADYDHHPPATARWFYASRYVLDAIERIAQPLPNRMLWFMDVDCVWLRPQAAFDMAPAAGSIGCVHMSYDIDWDITGGTRAAIERLSPAQLTAGRLPSWVGGEVLAGRPADMLALVAACEQIAKQIDGSSLSLGTEEQLLTIVDVLGEISFHDLSQVGARILTGPRHRGVNPGDPATLGVWHLPSEKGLGFRRCANELLRGREAHLRRVLADPDRAMSAFNLHGGRWTSRRLRDDSWLVFNRLLDAISGRLARIT